MLEIGTVKLGGKPCAAIAIQDRVEPQAIRAVGQDVIVELRLDALSDQNPASLLDFVRQYHGFNLLATIRHPDEGGGWKGTSAERLRCYETIMPEVHAVDVEIGSTDIAREVAELARAQGVVSIGSFHNFSQTPAREVLEEVHERGRILGMDVVKIAARCNSPQDLRRLAEFTLAHEAQQVITIGMGEHGLVSRIFFPALGSLLTYTFLGAPTAPGQLNCGDTLKYLDVFYPQGCG